VTAPLGAVVIPAHNESAVIGRCLDALQPLVDDGRIQVIVACNGCVDDTAAVARRRAGVVVVELATASKAAALRAGDRMAVPGPRIYLDADVVMSATAALAVMGALGHGDALAARPPIHFETFGAHWLVRAWYSVRVRLPSIRAALWGAGTYALSVEGRARFGEFPDIVSDDLFIDSLFSERETLIVDTDPVVVHTPRRTAHLLGILTRTYRTQDDVERKGGGGPVSQGQRGQLRDLVDLVVRRPRFVVAAVAYIALIALARARAKLGGKSRQWERDESSRNAAQPGGKAPELG
jgi:glycosyltransferase involved in cell wall biosynthesis